jgi:Ran GTPase-activating protein (RanGAP) involved in mRNA processing and transport
VERESAADIEESQALVQVKSSLVFVRALRSARNLLALNLHDNKLYEVAASTVFKELPKCCPMLEDLDLSDNGFYTTGHLCLLGALIHLPRMRRLVLHNTHLEHDVLQLYVVALGSLPALELLDVTGNYLTEADRALLQAAAPVGCLVNI